MSTPSQNYCNKVRDWMLCGVPLEKVITRPDQQLRALLVTEVYQHWISSPTIDPRKMLQNFAARRYSMLLRMAAEGDEQAKSIVAALNLNEGSVRTAREISNDIYVLNYLAGMLNTSKKHIHKLMFESNIEWMQNFGRKTGTWQAVKQANQDLAKINNDFKDEDDPQDQMPNTNINITGDVSIIKSDRKSLNDEERAALRRKWGLTAKEEAQELEEINGIWQQPDPDEDEPDIFVENEDD